MTELKIFRLASIVSRINLEENKPKNKIIRAYRFSKLRICFEECSVDFFLFGDSIKINSISKRYSSVDKSKGFLINNQNKDYFIDAHEYSDLQLIMIFGRGIKDSNLIGFDIDKKEYSNVFQTLLSMDMKNVWGF